jgi:hypothetical protein
LLAIQPTLPITLIPFAIRVAFRDIHMLASTQTLHSIHPVRNNINMHELTKLSNGGYRISPNIMSSIMVLDIIFRHHPLNTFVSVGQSFFVDSQDSAPLPGCLIARQGFYQSVRPASNQLILNVDTSATAFYSHGPMTDLACRILNCRHPNELPCSIPSCGHDKLDTFIKNVKFIVTHQILCSTETSGASINGLIRFVLYLN